MSNFKCEKCGVDIVEGPVGIYVTECKHYPLELTENQKIGHIILNIGHNDDCLFCGFKDKFATKLVQKRNMKIERWGWITRSHVILHHDKIFLFGDNLAGYGMGGQAKEMRGEPNAIGIPTKRFPNNSSEAFFKVSDYQEAKNAIDRAFDLIPRNSTVIIPASGLGTGLAKLQDTAPNILEYIEQKIRDLENL